MGGKGETLQMSIIKTLIVFGSLVLIVALHTAIMIVCMLIAPESSDAAASCILGYGMLYLIVLGLWWFNCGEKDPS